MNAPRSKPVHEVRYGVIKAAIWRNESENGTRYNTTFSKAYRDGEQWKNTDSFGRDDLLVVAKAASDAHTWIHQQPRESGTENSPGNGQSSSQGTPSRSMSASSGSQRNRPPREEADF
jgi:hypothetical protein